ncbi:MAG: metal ABC transporter permease [Spirochaetales bacterium]|nr:metal ABC transporter permease [Spirochaetales bacterium]
MIQFFEFLSIPPIQRGIVALLVSGIVLPMCGIPLIELNLLPMRFMLMHGALFAGTLAVFLGLSPILLMVVINIIFVITITYVNQSRKMDVGRISSFLMVFSLGGAAILSQIKSIPSQGILSILWGSPYSLTKLELWIFIIWAVVVVLILYILRDAFTIFLFDPVNARTLGVNTSFLGYLLNLIIGISVALAMKLLGALLVDVLLILPVVLAGFWKKGQFFYFALSIILGFILSFTGIIGSLTFNIPVSGFMALLGGFLFLIFIIFIKEKK